MNPEDGFDKHLHNSDYIFMKVTVEISEKDLKDVIKLSGETKKGPAIQKFIIGELMLKRRREMSKKFVAAKLNAELPGMESVRKDRNIWRR